jgi:nitrous oxidase accessory protein NosD
MNTQNELERIVRGWLEERVAEPRSAGLDDVLERLPTTPQRRRRWLDRVIRRMRGAMRSAHDRGIPTQDDRRRSRHRLLLTGSGLVASVAAATLAATLVIPSDRGGSLLAPGAGTGATHVVAQDGGGDFATIGEAIAAAADGDTVLVGPGEYVEVLVIGKDITLTGDGAAGEVVISIPPDAPTVAFEGAPFPYGIRLADSDATISDVTMEGRRDTVSLVVDGGSPMLSDLRVDGVGIAFVFIGASTPTLTGSRWDGYLAVRDSAAPVIEGNTITREVVSIDGPGETILRGNTFLAGAGTSLSAGATGIVEGNELTGGSIAVDTGSDVLVQGNTVREFRGDVSRGAIEVRDAGSRARIVGNRISGSSTGISVQSRTEASIEGNELTDNEVGMLILATDASVLSNTVTGARVGLAVTGAGSGEPVIEDNVIERAETGISLGATTLARLSRNRLCDNEVDLRVFGDNPTTLDGNEVCPETASGDPVG